MSRGFVQNLQTTALAIALVPVTGHHDVFQVAFLTVVEQRGAIRQHVVDQRIGMRNAGLQRVPIQATFQLRGAFRIKSGRAARVLDGAHRRVLAEQCALRAAQNLDPLEIIEVLVGHADMTEEYVVDDHPDRGFHVVVATGLADATQRNAGATRIRCGRREARRTLSQVCHREYGFAFESIAPEDGDGDRHILRALGTIARGHHHFVERILVALRGSFLSI